MLISSMGLPLPFTVVVVDNLFFLDLPLAHTNVVVRHLHIGLCHKLGVHTPSVIEYHLLFVVPNMCRVARWCDSKVLNIIVHNLGSSLNQNTAGKKNHAKFMHPAASVTGQLILC